MSATGNLANDAWDHPPNLKDLGMPNVVGPPARGVSIHSVQTTVMVAGQLG